MKNKDILTLSSINHKSDKKTFTRVNLSYSISLLILVIFSFVIISFTDGLKRMTNEYKTNAALSIHSYDKTTFNDYIKENIHTTNKLLYTTKSIEHHDYYDKETKTLEHATPTITIGNERFAYDSIFKREYSGEVYHPTHDYIGFYSNSFYSKEENEFLKKKYKSKVILAGTVATTKNEIIVSSKLLDDLNIAYTDAVGKKISYEIDSNSKLTQYDKTHYEVIKEYTVCGVYDYRLFASASRGENEEASCLFFMLEGSVISVPEYINDVYYCAAQYNDINDAKNAYKKNRNELIKELHISAGDILTTYIQFEPIYNLISVTSIICTIIIFLISLVNLYITQKYIYKQRQSYMYMCEINGMTKKDIKKEYIFQNLLTIIKPLIIIIVTSFIICLSFVLWFNYKRKNEVRGAIFVYQIGFNTYPLIITLAILINVALIVISSLIFYNKYKHWVSEKTDK